MTNKKPSHVSITKVKQFQGSSAFVKRSQWTIDQLRQVNGIDPNKVCNFPSPFPVNTSIANSKHVAMYSVLNFLIVTSCSFSLTTHSHFLLVSPFHCCSKDCPEFDLMFDTAFDQWVAGSSGEKCTFIQILHHTCQRYSSARKPEFVNCQSKLLGGKTKKKNFSKSTGSTAPDSLLSCCAVSQSESNYVWWQTAPGVYENACLFLVHSICWALCWREVKEDVQRNISVVTQSVWHRSAGYTAHINTH